MKVADAYSVDDLVQMAGCPVYDSEGARIGEIEATFYDVETSQPEWIRIRGGVLRNKGRFIPLAGVSAHLNGIQVPYSNEIIRTAPEIAAADDLSQDAERLLYT